MALARSVAALAACLVLLNVPVAGAHPMPTSAVAAGHRVRQGGRRDRAAAGPPRGRAEPPAGAGPGRRAAPLAARALHAVAHPRHRQRRSPLVGHGGRRAHRPQRPRDVANPDAAGRQGHGLRPALRRDHQPARDPQGDRDDSDAVEQGDERPPPADARGLRLEHEVAARGRGRGLLAARVPGDGRARGPAHRRGRRPPAVPADAADPRAAGGAPRPLAPRRRRAAQRDPSRARRDRVRDRPLDHAGARDAGFDPRARAARGEPDRAVDPRVGGARAAAAGAARRADHRRGLRAGPWPGVRDAARRPRGCPAGRWCPRCWASTSASSSRSCWSWR